MQFNKIIMNPPYKGDLHLNIIIEAKRHLVDSGECVNLSPILWSQINYTGKVPEGIQYIERVQKSLAQKLFARNPTDLGVYYILNNCDSNKFNRFLMMGFNNYKDISNIYDKIQCKTILTFKDKITSRNKPLDKYSVIYSHMSGLNNNHNFVYINGIGENGKQYKENVKNQHKNDTSTHFEFNTFNEANNFRESLLTTFFKFIEIITQPGLLRILDELPYMGDYTKQWDDNRFYKYFEITDYEKYIIESTVKQYGTK